MRAVAEQLADGGPGEVTVLFSHYHLDHMAGLAMNPLFYNEDWSFTFVGPSFADGGVHDAVSRLLAPPYWPISVDGMSADMRFAPFATDGIDIGRLHVRGCPMPHPGGCMSYRVDDATCRASLVYATDIEWSKRTADHEKAFMSMCSEPEPADVLSIDAHLARADEKAFAGWGHTSWEDCLEIARSAGIKRVLLGHHDPRADDEALRILEQQVKKCMSGAAPARAGQWLTIGAER
jgi:ribonuclease BN (tRNA processing enzyme)